MINRCAACGHPTDNRNEYGIGACCTEGLPFDPTGAKIAGYYDRVSEGNHYTEEGR